MSRHTVRRLAAASLAVTVAATLAACSSGSSSSPQSSGAGGGTISLWTHNGGNDAELAADQKIVDDFNSSQSQYTVKLQSFPQASYNDAVVAAASAKKLPCIVDIDSPNVPNWAWAGYIKPLGLPDSEWSGQLASTVGKVNDKVYSFGHYDVALAFYTRKSILQSVGARVPTVAQPWTKSEFADVLAKLKATGKYPYALDLGTGGTGEWITYAYSPFLQSAGGDLIDRSSYKKADG
ncbi:MAG: extracellular solute-binding protein, partial [Cellulomonas sp.]|nr:extracellular solute-binding protein [Cellulomonas sp.]